MCAQSNERDENEAGIGASVSRLLHDNYGRDRLGLQMIPHNKTQTQTLFDAIMIAELLLSDARVFVDGFDRRAGS